MCKDNCLTQRNKCIGILVLFCLICAFAFNIVVATSCEYLSGPTGNLQLGIFRYSLNLPASQFDTGGQCSSYDASFVDKPAAKTSQSCAILAPIFGFLAMTWISFNQFCCPMPCSNILTGLYFFAAQVCTILVWFVYVNDVCIAVTAPDGSGNASIETSCDFGTAATFNLLASILYFAAWLLNFLLPSPKEAQLARMVDEANKRADDAEERAEEAEGKMEKMNVKDEESP